MKSLIGAALVAGVFALTGPAAVSPAFAASQAATQPTAGPGATDFSARRYYRHHHYYYGYRPYYRPYYYARP